MIDATKPGALYEVLGVAPTATHAEVKAAYRRRISEAHPDRGGETGDAAAINEAWEVLGDPEARANYDATGEVKRGIPVAQAAEVIVDDLVRQWIAESFDLHGNVVEQWRSRSRSNTSNVEAMLVTLRREIERIEVKRKRLRAPAFVEPRFTQEINARKLRIAQMERQIEIDNAVLELLAQCEDTGPVKAPRSEKPDVTWVLAGPGISAYPRNA